MNITSNNYIFSDYETLLKWNISPAKLYKLYFDYIT